MLFAGVEVCAWPPRLVKKNDIICKTAFQDFETVSEETPHATRRVSSKKNQDLRRALDLGLLTLDMMIAKEPRSTAVPAEPSPAAAISRGSTRASSANSSASGRICAIVENRARETCIAAIDTQRASVLQLSCVQDGQSYTKTLAALRAAEASEILLHDGSRGRVLSSKVVGAFHGPTSRVLFVSRQYFDQDKGAETLKRLASGSVNAEMMSKYTALAASYCLIRYVENAMGLMFADASLRIRADSGGDRSMSIDRSTAKELELITDTRSGGQKKSLFGVINHTRTAVGARLLRSTILAPSTDIATIEERLDLVTFFLTMEGVFTNTFKILGELTDLDRMLGDLVTVPRQVTEVTARRGIATLICLRHTLRLIGPLTDALEEGMRESAHQKSKGIPLQGEEQGQHAASTLERHEDEVDQVEREGGPVGGSPLLKAMLDNFRDPCLDKILERLDGVLTESTSYSRNSAMMRHQECFAVRPDVDGMLDVARKTFLQSMEDIYQTADAMSEENGYQVKVAFSASRGYHLVIPAGVEGLPDGLVQAVQNVKTITCTTEEVASLSDRASEAVRTALLITHDVVQQLADDIRAEGLDALFAVTESVALLDMIFGFADLVTLSPLPFNRPEVTADGPMTICGGRHAIVGEVQDGKFVPNDTHMSPFMNFRVVTGPNNSGKSTYLKQAGLIVIMAQMGCYVPAEMAVIPVRHSLLSRIGTGDDMENNVSTFLMEMQEVAQVLERVTSTSLILVDELGRGTSNREGLAVAWAVAEKLLSSSAYTLFVTHYAQIPGLAELYPNVKNIHLQTAVMATGGSREQRGSLRYLHKARDGRCDTGDGYGIRTAEMCGLPWEIVEEARILRARVIDAAKAKDPKGGEGAASEGDKNAHELLRTLAMLKKGSTMDRLALREFLHVLSLEYKGPKAIGIFAAVAKVGTAGVSPAADASLCTATSAPIEAKSAEQEIVSAPSSLESPAGTPGTADAAGTATAIRQRFEAAISMATPATGSALPRDSSAYDVSASSRTNAAAAAAGTTNSSSIAADGSGVASSTPSHAELEMTPGRGKERKQNAGEVPRVDGSAMGGVAGAPLGRDGSVPVRLNLSDLPPHRRARAS